MTFDEECEEREAAELAEMAHEEDMAKAMTVSVAFVARENAPERLVCEAELIFKDGPLAGMKMVGFSLWRSPEGEVYVTFPSRAFGTGSDRRFFDFLRSVEGSAADAKRVKAWIAEQYRAQQGEA
jgi:hypothetical protein